MFKVPRISCILSLEPTDEMKLLVVLFALVAVSSAGIIKSGWNSGWSSPSYISSGWNSGWSPSYRSYGGWNDGWNSGWSSPKIIKVIKPSSGWNSGWNNGWNNGWNYGGGWKSSGWW